jgi:hypothetical protein
VVLLAIASISCKHKKKISLSGDDLITVNEFIESFQPVKLPYQFGDTSLNKKTKDSLLISYKVFTQFVPDTVLSRVFGKAARPKIYPMGRVSVPKQETYLFVKTLTGDRKAALIVCFDKKNKFLASIPALVQDAGSSTKQSGSIDRRYSISKSVFRKNADGSVKEIKNVYALNEAAKSFTLIMTDAPEEKNAEVVNPVDTLSKKSKFAADYKKDKKNFVSFRDSKRPGRIIFFVHFEENKGKCIGDLKGEAVFTSSTTAVYHSTGDPCVLQFNFTPFSVTMTEIDGCGSHRGIDCVFKGTFPKKKEIKKSKKKSKK